MQCTTLGAGSATESTSHSTLLRTNQNPSCLCGIGVLPPIMFQGDPQSLPLSALRGTSTLDSKSHTSLRSIAVSVLVTTSANSPTWITSSRSGRAESDCSSPCCTTSMVSHWAKAPARLLRRTAGLEENHPLRRCLQEPLECTHWTGSHWKRHNPRPLCH